MVMKHFSLRSFIWLMIGLSTYCQSKVLINLRIYNYRNPENLMHNGRKCEYYLFTNDACDPMFQICVTSRNRCDIFNGVSGHWNNQKYIDHVISKTFKLENITKSLTLEVKVDDYDIFNSHDHIASFHSTFNISQINQIYSKHLTITPAGLNINLSAEVMMRCQEHYYGVDCNQFCKPKMVNYNCSSMTGEKLCLLSCGNEGSCSLNVTRDAFSCICKSGSTGDHCQFIRYDNCSLLNCNKTCRKDETKIHCTCYSDNKKETCSEMLALIPITKQSLETELILSTQRSTYIFQNVFFDYLRNTTSQITERNTEQFLRNRKEELTPLTTIIIICLSLLLCIGVIAFIFLFRNWKKKNSKNIDGSPTFSRRPLPPVLNCTALSGDTLREHSQCNYDSCTLQTEFNYETIGPYFDSTDLSLNMFVSNKDLKLNADNYMDQLEVKKIKDNESDLYLEPMNVFQK